MQSTDSLETQFRFTGTQKAALKRLGILTIKDLLFHLPFRYDQGGSESTIEGLRLGMSASIVGTLEKLETKKSWRRKIPVSEGYVRDATGRIKCRWFNQPYIAKMYSEGVVVKATGKVSGSGE